MKKGEQLFRNQFLSQKIDPDSLIDRPLPCETKSNQNGPLPTQYNYKYSLMDKPTYHRPKIAHQEMQIQLQIKKLDMNKELNFMQ